MVQNLRAFPALPEDYRSFPGTTSGNSQSHATPAPGEYLSPSSGLHMHSHMHIPTQDIHIYT